MLPLLHLHIGNANPGDWWTALESEPSLGSSAQLHQPAFLRGPEFVSTLMEMEGPFTNVTKGERERERERERVCVCVYVGVSMLSFVTDRGVFVVQKI